jgi:hypothetical protein
VSARRVEILVIGGGIAGLSAARGVRPEQIVPDSLR